MSRNSTELGTQIKFTPITQYMNSDYATTFELCIATGSRELSATSCGDVTDCHFFGIVRAVHTPVHFKTFIDRNNYKQLHS